MDKARALEKFLRDRGSWPPGLRQPSGMGWQQVSQAAELAGELAAELDQLRQQARHHAGLAEGHANDAAELRQQLAAALAEIENWQSVKADLMARVVVAEAERERDAKDAERYRWLRANASEIWWLDAAGQNWSFDDMRYTNEADRAELDRAIDAAIATGDADAAQRDA